MLLQKILPQDKIFCDEIYIYTGRIDFLQKFIKFI